MFDWLKRLVCDHNWIVGKAAPREAQKLGWECYHNRACIKCGKVDNAADRAEVELERISMLQGSIGPDRRLNTDELTRRARELLDKDQAND